MTGIDVYRQISHPMHVTDPLMLLMPPPYFGKKSKPYSLPPSQMVIGNRSTKALNLDGHSPRKVSKPKTISVQDMAAHVMTRWFLHTLRQHT